MEVLKNINYNQIKRFGFSDENMNILRSLNKIIDVVKDPAEFNQILNEMKSTESIISIYSSICMLLGETHEIVSNSIDVDDILYQYMVLIRQIIQSNEQLRFSLFGGLSDFGFGINSIYKSRGHFKKFIDSFNELLVNSVKYELSKLVSDIGNLKTESFDFMAGISGVASYLLLYKEEAEISECIKDILKYLISLTQDREVLGYKVPSYYLSSKNHFSKEEKEFYNKGSFNLGVSHGITGPLAILAIALSQEIEVEGQKEAIHKILSDLKTFSYTDNKEAVYWAGRVSFDEYINKKAGMVPNRAGWCYGSPGIARSIYLAGKAVNDKESIELSLKTIYGLCKMNKDEWMLDSPTICHGYAGLLVVIQAMYEDTKDNRYKYCIDKLSNILLDSYKDDSIFGFMNIDPKEVKEGVYNLVEEDSITLLQGSVGIILTLLSTIYKPKTDWRNHLLVY